MAEKILRAHRPVTQSSRHSVGHQAGLHPEDTPRLTTDTQSRKPARIEYDDEDEIFTDRRMPVIVKKYNRTPVTTRTRTHVTEETIQARVTPLRFFIIAIGIILASFVIAAMIIVLLIPAYNRWNDDRLYGYPRTIHSHVNIGRGTVTAPYSDFTGENINGFLYVIELEETDPSQSTPHIYFINRYSGDNKDLIAITAITFVDENGDGKVDMVVTVENGSMFVLFNNGKTFTAIAPK